MVSLLPPAVTSAVARVTTPIPTATASSPAGTTAPVTPVPVQQRHRFRHDIEGLRAVAVLLVALNHAALPFLGGGFVGVDVFFVISGFLITGLLLSESERSGRVSLADFYARRARRILPMSALVAVVTMVAAYDLAGTAIGNRTAVDAGWAAVFLANIHFAASGVDYFNRGTVPSPLQHYWSLGVEEQFYLVWPVVVIVVGLLVAAQRRRAVLVRVLVAVCVVSLAWSVLQTATAPTAAYFSPFTRAFELGIGALLAILLRSRRSHLLPRWATAATAVGMGMVVLAVLALDESTAFPGAWALLPTIGVALVVLGGTDAPDGPVSRALSVRPMRFVGERSYGFYLWHFPWLILPTAALGRTPALHVELLLLVGAFVTSCLTFALIEDPVRQLTVLRDARPAVSLVMGAVLVVGVLGTSVVLQRLNAVTYVQDDAAAASSLPTSAQVESLVAASVGLPAAPEDLDPPADGVAEFGSLTAEESACDKDYDVETAEDCFLGAADAGAAESTIAIWGDSHASMWTPALGAIAEQTDRRLAVYAKYGCAPLLGITPWHPTEDRPYDECTSYKDSVVPLLEDLRPDVLLLTGAFRGWAWSEDGARQAGGDFTSDNRWIPNDEVDGVWDAALASTLQELAPLAEAGTRIVVLGDSSYPTQDGGLCLSTNADDLAACEIPRADGAFDTHNDAEAATAEQYGATYVPVVPWFCTAETCPPVVGTTAVYRDAYHMTRQYAVLLARAMGEATGLIEPGSLPAPAGDAGTGSGTDSGTGTDPGGVGPGADGQTPVG